MRNCRAEGWTEHLENIQDIRLNRKFREISFAWKLKEVRRHSLQKHRLTQSQTWTYHTGPDPGPDRGEELKPTGVLHTVILQFWRECVLGRAGQWRPQQQQQGCVTFLWQCRVEGRCQWDSTSAFINRERGRERGRKHHLTIGRSVFKPANKRKTFPTYFWNTVIINHVSGITIKNLFTQFYCYLL